LLLLTNGNNFTCSVGHRNIWFGVEIGGKQSCVMSALLLTYVIDWVMRKPTEDLPRGIRWNISSTIEDLDFADDLALLSQTHDHLQEKTDRFSNFANQVGLKISQTKTEVMTLNITALLSLFMMSFPMPPSFLTVLPRYMNVSVFGRSFSSTCIGVGLVMFKVITSVFVWLIFSPTWLAKLLKRSVFSCKWS
jgi:uncharacterized protein YqhQ